MPKHIITRTYDNLKGFSTDSIYLRPPNVSEKALNIHKDPDGTFTSRRGYQCSIADIGGLGITSFDNPCRCGIEFVCVHRDGNLYRKIDQDITINFTLGVANTPNAWFQFEIFTNPNTYNNQPGWSFSPWSITPWSSPTGESINFLGYIKSAAIVNGDQTNVNTINVQAGHLINVGDQISILSQENQYYDTRTVSATTLTSITFIGTPLTVKDADRIDISVEQLFLRGYDVNTPYPISQFITLLNTILGVTAYTLNNTTSYPAAFIPIQENVSLISGNQTIITFSYWQKIPAPISPLLPGSANAINQNSANFENASFCIYDEVLYVTNGFDNVMKYDGQNAYLAGMPTGDRPNVTTGAGGHLGVGDYLYAITYEQKDNATHIIEGAISPSFKITVAANNLNSVILNDIVANTGYNTNAALATGAADTIYGSDGDGYYYHIIPVNVGHTFHQGDTAYYLNRSIATFGAYGGTPTTRLNVLAGHGVVIGDVIIFNDAGGQPRQRTVLDIDNTGANPILEISGLPVAYTPGDLISSYIESPLYGHVGIVNGDQNNVTTINLINNQTIVTGDTVVIKDSLGNINYRLITAFTANSITFDNPISVKNGQLIYAQTLTVGAITTGIDTDKITLQSKQSTAITLNALDPISNNLRINIYRTQADGTLFQLVSSIPNNSFSATQTFVDDFVDAELGVNFSNPTRLPNPPPKCKYIFAYQNMIIYAGGARDNSAPDISQDSVYFSEGDQPEAVPAATNFFLVPSNDDIISGINQSGSVLVVGKDRSIYTVAGDLLTSQFEVQPVAPGSNIGVAAHHSMKSIGNLLYFMHTNGVYTMSESQLFPTDPFGTPIPISKPIDVIFRTKNFDVGNQFVLKRAVASNYSKDNEYWLFLPCENPNGTMRNANENSRVFVFDYQDKNWFEWSNINAAGGFVQLQDNIYWQERRLSGFIGNTSNLYRQHRHYRLIDYADHTQPINVEWNSSWEDLQYPQVRKKYIRCVLLFDRIDSLYQLDQPFINFSSYLDRIPNLQNTIAPVTTVNNSVQWGSAWSWKKWSGLVDPFIRINFKNGTVAKALQIGLKMKELNTSYKFQGFQLEISPDYEKTIVR